MSSTSSTITRAKSAKVSLPAVPEEKVETVGGAWSGVFVASPRNAFVFIFVLIVISCAYPNVPNPIDWYDKSFPKVKLPGQNNDDSMPHSFLMTLLYAFLLYIPVAYLVNVLFTRSKSTDEGTIAVPLPKSKSK
jgi:hypothetical protein